MNISRKLGDMDFMFEWQKQYLLLLLEHKIHIFLATV